MGIGECRVVQPDLADGKIKDGEIVFIRQGPVNLIPLVEAYEKQNKDQHKGTQKSILEGKHGLSEREL